MIYSENFKYYKNNVQLSKFMIEIK